MSRILEKLEGEVIYLGKRRPVKEGKRYKIMLSTLMNDLWEEVRRQGMVLEVYVVPVKKGKG